MYVCVALLSFFVDCLRVFVRVLCVACVFLVAFVLVDCLCVCVCDSCCMCVCVFSFLRIVGVFCL